MGVSPAYNDAVLQTLEQIVGAAGVSTTWEAVDAARRIPIERAIAPDSTIAFIVFPNTQAELAEVMTCIHAHGWQVVPCGAGSKLDWGGIVGTTDENKHHSPLPTSHSPLIIISTERLNQLIEHAIGDLTVTVEAGVRFAALQATLAQAGQFLAIDPDYPEQATIGGIVATANTGSLRQRYNSVRDMLLGISFVRADGQIAKAGGRVVKNVAGYDLMKLFTGSYGTLGIITQVTFRVYPLPESSQTVVLSGAAESIAQAVKTLLGSALTPVSTDLLSSSVVQGMEIGKGMGLAVRFQSILSSVREQSTRMAEVGEALGLVSHSYLEAEEVDLWKQLRKRMMTRSSDMVVTCKIGISPSTAIALFDYINQLSISPTWLGQIHAASGLGRLTFHDSAIQPDDLIKIRTFCQTNSGFLSVLQAPITFKQQVDIWGYSGNALEVMHRIKQQFDPDYRLSPNRFVEGI